MKKNTQKNCILIVVDVVLAVSRFFFVVLSYALKICIFKTGIPYKLQNLMHFEFVPYDFGEP